jgi:hypothetical protein
MSSSTNDSHFGPRGIVPGPVASGVGKVSAPAPRPALRLEALVTVAREIACVRRGDLLPGDRLLVATKNSVYRLVARADGRFDVSGGIFARESPTDAGERPLAVCGCTAGGRALFTGVVAAPGLFLEFGDGTSTTRIRRVRRIGGVRAHQRGAG